MALEITWHFISHAWINSCRCHRNFPSLQARSWSFPEVSWPCGVSAVLQNLFGAVPQISLVLEGRVGAQAVSVHPCAHLTPGRSSYGSLLSRESISAAIPWLSLLQGPSRGLRLPKKPDECSASQNIHGFCSL